MVLTNAPSHSIRCAMRMRNFNFRYERLEVHNLFDTNLLSQPMLMNGSFICGRILNEQEYNRLFQWETTGYLKTMTV